VTARTASEAARDGSITARDAAIVVRDAAIAARTAAETARDAAIAARTAAETARDAAIAARDAAVAARTGSEAARDLSIAARDTAIAKAAEAAASATTLNNRFLGVKTLATLPQAATAGASSIAFLSDGQKSGEALGAGTGVFVYSDGAVWRRSSDDADALPYSDHTLALNYKSSHFRSGTFYTRDGSTLPGRTYTRAGAKYELLAGVGLTPFAAGVPGIVSGIGYWVRGALTNKLTHYNANPNEAAGTTETVGGANTIAGMVPLGDAFGVLSVVDDTANLQAAGLSGAGGPCTTGKVYKLDNSLGAAATTVYFSGASGNTNAHTGSAFIRGGTGSILSSSAAEGSAAFAATAQYTRRQITFTPGDATKQVSIRADAGQVIYFILAQFVEGPQAGPVIVTAGAAAPLGADNLRVSSPITVEEDFVLWVVVDFREAAPSTGRRLLSCTDGTFNNRFLLERVANNGVLTMAYVIAGGAYTSINSPLAQLTPGRCAVLVRRRAGKWTCAAKNSAGTISASAESGLVALPAGLSGIDIGNQAGGTQPDSPIEFVGIRRGTFSDADVTAILGAA
jgi:hypothetical protein